MRILVIGSGGREHALAWKLSQSPVVERVYGAPGNPGISQCGECIPAGDSSPQALLAAAERVEADLTVVGPELPLVAGVVNAFRAAGRPIVGPTGPTHGFVGAITEFDSREGTSTGALFEGGGGEGIAGGGGYIATTNQNGQPAGAVLAYGGVGVSSPVGSASGGLVGFGSGGKVSGVGLYGEGFLFGRGGGGGAYLNITNVGNCHQ